MGALIDRQILLEVCDQDEEMAAELLEAFCEEGICQIDNLNMAFSDKNWKDYVIYVHGMKSSARSIGASSAAEEALNLEMAGKQDNISYINDNHESFLNLFKDTINEANMS